MNPILKKILAFLGGAAAGSAINIGIIMIRGYVISPPEVVDVKTTEGLKVSMHLFQPKHFIMPFILETGIGLFENKPLNHKLIGLIKFRSYLWEFLPTALKIKL